MATPSQHVARVMSLAFSERGALAQRSPDPNVIRSWSRCLQDYRLAPTGAYDTLVLDQPRLAERQARLEDIIEIARVEMDSLYQQISGSGSAIILTDCEGYILNCVTDPDAARLFQRAGLWLGANWSEEHEGTNGIGTCLIERQPITIHRDDHFLSRHIGLSCSAAPIFDPQGQLVAVLDASTVNSRDSKQSQYHAMALATISAKLIENCAFVRCYRQQWVLRFHHRPEFVGLLSEGMIAFDGEGRILALNQSALNQLGSRLRSELVGLPIGALFDAPLELLMGRSSLTPAAVWPIRDHAGHGFFAMLRGPEQVPLRIPAVAPPRSIAPAQPIRLDLAGLRGQDPQMAYNVRCAERVMNKDVTILLNGETGTGKEAFAKAVHLASARAGKPFVAVNCAAIPENLIESELFGYRHGAFTGARREGMRGKILQADGGTLFLDEIGDMPLTLQTRLLRVLEEREVLPLGAEHPIPVDIRLISATHRDLAAMVAAGQFREDLYYRLNGLVLSLPPLRERADIAEVIRGVLALECGNQPIRLSFEAFDCLAHYPWPGNIRQLRNVLRTAIALCEGDLIRLEDLPPELTRRNSTQPQGVACAPVGMTALIAPPTADLPVTMTETEGRALQNAEKMALLRELEAHRWNMTSTAQHLGISRNTLYRKLKKHGITPPTLAS
ncbi:MAG TPA: sigma-54-dependent Fis family transcriptional regulator [Candidatus Competibacteraceae bacterium]|nr:sigma-54-dependent Fis family transcriptional regulator [Candidatus Competibacteraceae bacterium]